MKLPADLKYSNDHEWTNIEKGIATVGITDFAQSELGDIVFVEFPELNESFNAGETFGTIEAVKTVADLFMPVGGQVIAINESLNTDPSKINSDPYGEGWIIKVRMSEAADAERLLSADTYAELIS